MKTQTKEFLFKFFNNEVSINEFENWINSNTDIIETVHQTVYQDLILADFQNKNIKSQIEDKLAPYIDVKEYSVWQTKKILIGIIEDKIDIVLACRYLHELYYRTGEKFIPIALGIGFDSELDDVPTPDEYSLWNEDVLKERLKKVDWYKPKIKMAAEEFLQSIIEK